jgi:hypothetical protein
MPQFDRLAGKDETVDPEKDGCSDEIGDNGRGDPGTHLAQHQP